MSEKDQKITLGGIPLKEVYDSASCAEKISKPGEYPYTRGIHKNMYLGKMWTMRQFAGFGSPKDTNERFKYLLGQGITGLSTAFDMPTLMGYDADHAISEGEVGREGVSVSTINDMEVLFKDVDLTKITTSMTINCSAAPVLAMYFAVALRRKNLLDEIGGTIQNDILKEFIAQKEWISPPKPSVKIVCDVIEYCAKEVKKFNPVSISGYHIREAGSTAAQELAFTIYNGVTYVEECVKRGLSVDDFAPRLSFFFDVHNDFFEEIAKLRAARRIWATLMKERFGAKDSRSLLLRMHAQTAGVSLTAQQPLNNVARVAIQALAGVLGGTQSLHTNSLDETLSLPTENAVKVALRTQQIIAEETGVANVVDPLGGSYFVEALTDEIEKIALDYIRRLDEMGGMVRAIELGFPQSEISQSAYHYQRELEAEKSVIVGVNKYRDDSVEKTPILKIDSSVEEEQIKAVTAFKAGRGNVSANLTEIHSVCSSGDNIMPALIKGVEAGVSVGEVSQIFREVFGVYKDPGLI